MWKNIFTFYASFTKRSDHTKILNFDIFSTSWILTRFLNADGAAQVLTRINSGHRRLFVLVQNTLRSGLAPFLNSIGPYWQPYPLGYNLEKCENRNNIRTSNYYYCGQALLGYSPWMRTIVLGIPQATCSFTKGLERNLLVVDSLVIGKCGNG